MSGDLKLERPYPTFMFKPTMDALNLQNFKEVDNLPRGTVIATAELIGCWEIALDQVGAFLCVPYRPGIPDDFERVIPRTSNEYLFGDFTPGDYAWEFTNVVMLPEPIPARGQQRLWNWDMPSWLSSRYRK